MHPHAGVLQLPDVGGIAASGGDELDAVVPAQPGDQLEQELVPLVPVLADAEPAQGAHAEPPRVAAAVGHRGFVLRELLVADVLPAVRYDDGFRPADVGADELGDRHDAGDARVDQPALDVGDPLPLLPVGGEQGGRRVAVLPREGRPIRLQGREHLEEGRGVRDDEIRRAVLGEPAHRADIVVHGRDGQAPERLVAAEAAHRHAVIALLLDCQGKGVDHDGDAEPLLHPLRQHQDPRHATAPPASSASSDRPTRPNGA